MATLWSVVAAVIIVSITVALYKSPARRFACEPEWYKQVKLKIKLKVEAEELELRFITA